MVRFQLKREDDSHMSCLSKDYPLPPSLLPLNQWTITLKTLSQHETHLGMLLSYLALSGCMSLSFAAEVSVASIISLNPWFDITLAICKNRLNKVKSLNHYHILSSWYTRGSLLQFSTDITCQLSIFNHVTMIGTRLHDHHLMKLISIIIWNNFIYFWCIASGNLNLQG